MATASPPSPKPSFWTRRWPAWLWLTPGMFSLLVLAAVIWAFVLATPPQSLPTAVQAGEVDGGWTQVGNGTRLQYLDMPEGVRCYRMRYSTNLSCVRVP